MPSDKIKLIGFTVSLTWLSVIVLAFFIKSLGVLLDGWFSANALIILIVTGIILLFLIATGTITLTSMTSKGKGIFN
jgi:hypothetical protein